MHRCDHCAAPLRWRQAASRYRPLFGWLETDRLDRRSAQEWDEQHAGLAWRVHVAGPHLVFTGRYGTPIDPRTLNRAFTTRCTKAECPPGAVGEALKTWGGELDEARIGEVVVDT